MLAGVLYHPPPHILPPYVSYPATPPSPPRFCQEGLQLLDRVLAASAAAAVAAAVAAVASALQASPLAALSATLHLLAGASPLGAALWPAPWACPCRSLQRACPAQLWRGVWNQNLHSQATDVGKLLEARLCWRAVFGRVIDSLIDQPSTPPCLHSARLRDPGPASSGLLHKQRSRGPSNGCVRLVSQLNAPSHRNNRMACGGGCSCSAQRNGMSAPHSQQLSGFLALTAALVSRGRNNSASTCSVLLLPCCLSSFLLSLVPCAQWAKLTHQLNNWHSGGWWSIAWSILAVLAALAARKVADTRVKFFKGDNTFHDKHIKMPAA